MVSSINVHSSFDSASVSSTIKGLRQNQAIQRSRLQSNNEIVARQLGKQVINRV